MREERDLVALHSPFPVSCSPVLSPVHQLDSGDILPQVKAYCGLRPQPITPKLLRTTRLGYPPRGTREAGRVAGARGEVSGQDSTGHGALDNRPQPLV
jgi:hypothetical protein